LGDIEAVAVRVDGHGIACPSASGLPTMLAIVRCPVPEMSTMGEVQIEFTIDGDGRIARGN